MDAIVGTSGIPGSAWTLGFGMLGISGILKLFPIGAGPWGSTTVFDPFPLKVFWKGFPIFWLTPEEEFKLFSGACENTFPENVGFVFSTGFSCSGNLKNLGALSLKELGPPMSCAWLSIRSISIKPGLLVGISDCGFNKSTGGRFDSTVGSTFVGNTVFSFVSSKIDGVGILNWFIGSLLFISFSPFSFFVSSKYISKSKTSMVSCGFSKTFLISSSVLFTVRRSFIILSNICSCSFSSFNFNKERACLSDILFSKRASWTSSHKLSNLNLFEIVDCFTPNFWANSFCVYPISKTFL